MSQKAALPLHATLAGLLSILVFGSPAQGAAELTPIPDDGSAPIRLPLRIIIARGVTMQKRGVAMNSWIAIKDLKQVVLPELNRIWEPARIEWAIESVIEQEIDADTLADSTTKLEQIGSSRRDADGKSDPTRVPLIKAFFDPDQAHPVAQTVHLFPYLGTTSQGFATGGGVYSCLGLWTDKPSRGIRPPQRTLLVEAPPMKIGSLSRTLAHELGHNLGLTHPQKNVRSGGRLMGGPQQGYTLTPAEIATARTKAASLARRIRIWAERD